VISVHTYITPAATAKLPFTGAQMTAAGTTIDGAHSARVAAQSKATTAAEHAACDAGLEIVVDHAAWVEGFANTTAAGNFDLAVQIVLSFAFQPKKEPAPKVQAGFEASSPVKGELDVHVPTGPRDAVRLVRVSVDGGKTYGASLIVHGKILTVFGLVSATTVFVQQTTSVPPPKRAKVRIAAGTDGLVWSDPISCVIS
jgi:hypothetical protein